MTQIKIFESSRGELSNFFEMGWEWSVGISLQSRQLISALKNEVGIFFQAEKKDAENGSMPINSSRL